jgi:hypothetical protein
MQPKTVKQIFAGLSFFVALIVYSLTVAPTVSFWDCGEFIAAAYTQGVPHPPGAPLYLLVARIFTFIPEFLIADVALRVNIISVLSSAVTVLLTFLIIVRFLDWMNPDSETEENGKLFNYIGAFIGALVFAFSDSFWFNAVEAEVYAPSMFFTAIIAWLVIRWGEYYDRPGNERYLVLIAYLIGLAIGVHLLNVLAIPFVVYIVYFRKIGYSQRNLFFATLVGIVITGVVFLVIINKLPFVPSHFGFAGLIILFAVLLLAAWWAIRQKYEWTSLALMATVLIVVGYSTYGYIYVRSGLNPNIDENDPETIESFISYMQREQYGVSQGFEQDYLIRKAPFWSYQVNKMYIRYFAWNFLGRDESTEQADYLEYLLFPFLLGLFGAYRQAKKSPQYAFANFVLFFMTGIAIILYLNQPDPQPRERDYSHVGSFFAFAIWVGIGAGEILRLAREQFSLSSKVVAQFAPLLLLVPGIMLARNYESHDRSGNYVAWDYSYNMLQSCEPNGILLTNGDNDTFPLWYLQEVEGIRTDVRIANLSLLNTDWYIKQLRDLDPKIPIRLSDKVIESLRPRMWSEENHKQFFHVDSNVVRSEVELFNREYPERALSEPSTRIDFTVPPTWGPAIRVADLMSMRMLYTTKLRQPIYFAVTVAPDNMLGTLRDNYMRMDGLVFKITPVRNWVVSPSRLQQNLMQEYQYRNLDDPEVYYNSSTKSLLQNYRSAFLQLTDYYLRRDSVDTAREAFAFMNEKVPADVIPFTNMNLYITYTYFAVAAGYLQPEEVGRHLLYANPLRTEQERQRIDSDMDMYSRQLLNEGRYRSAANVLTYLMAKQPSQGQYVRSFVLAAENSNQQDKIRSVLEERLAAGLLQESDAEWAMGVLNRLNGN